MTTSTTAREVTGLMQRYAKRFNAGAFAMPIASDYDKNPSLFRQYDDGRIITHTRHVSSASTRADWTGRKYVIPKGAIFAAHVARAADSLDREVPPELIADHDYLVTYVEDHKLTNALLRANRPVIARRVSAASELLTVWGPRGVHAHEELPWDVPTVKKVYTPPFDLRAVRSELEALEGWADDYPLYSDGSWDALSLRGFYPEDPTRGVKPAEMDRKWKAEHAHDLDRPCGWTVLGDQLPVLRELVESYGFPKLERVRLLRMRGTGTGALGRHTDILDRAGGTKDGQIVRFHLPLITDPAIKLYWWELDGTPCKQHLQTGSTYYLDARKPHAVTNPTTLDRIHLVIDAVCDEDTREQLAS